MSASSSRSIARSRPHIGALLAAATMFAGASLAMAQPSQDKPPSQTQSPAAPAGQAAPTTAPAEPKAPELIRNSKEWNLGKNNLAIDGYDPVTYHPEFGGAATQGSEKIVLNYEGVVYRFATEANRQEFQRDPAKYEPAHGGWCSWAVKDADKVEIDPKSFIVKDGRLFLFYKGFFGDTRARWLKLDHQAQVKQADEQWKKLSNELPRIPAPAPKDVPVSKQPKEAATPAMTEPAPTTSPSPAPATK